MKYLFLLLTFCAYGVYARNPQVSIIKVKNTHDSVPFLLTLEESSPQPGCKAYHVSFPSPFTSDSPANNTVTGELYRPLNVTGRKSAPAVLVFHIIGPADFQLERLQCRNLAQNGVTAMFFHLPYYGPRGGGAPQEAMLQSPQRFLKALKQAVLDSKRAVDVLLHFKDVSPQKIGATGVSLGSLMTANAVARDRRFSSAMMTLGGGDLRQIIRQDVYETLAIRQFLKKQPPENRENILEQLDDFDPLACAPALARLQRRGRFAMINAENDHIIPPNCSTQLAVATGAKIQWFEDTDHYTFFAMLPKFLKLQTQFFIRDVPKSWRRPQYQLQLGHRLTAITARAFRAFLGAEPPQDKHAHELKGKLQVNLLNGIPLAFNVHFILGPQHAFKFNNSFFTAGQDDASLWLKEHDRLLDIPTKTLGKYNLFDNPIVNTQELKLFLAGLAFLQEAPDLLTDYITIKAKTAKDGVHNLTLLSKYSGYKGSCYVTFSKAGTPKELNVSLDGISASLEIHELKLNSPMPENTFAPPTASITGKLNHKQPFHDLFRRIFPFPTLLAPIQN